MPGIDLTPFGFTPTESAVYAALLRLGPATGYGVAREVRIARANAYGALEGLVRRGAAARAPGRPARYRPADPQTLMAHLATLQGEALDRLARALAHAARPGDPVTREIAGARAVANLVLQLVARADRRIDGVLAADLWRPTLPAWRRAHERAALEVRTSGTTPPEAEALSAGSVAADTPTVLIIDEAQVIVAAGAGDAVAGIWTSHPLLVALARGALMSLR